MITYDLDTLTLTNVGEDVNDENRQALSGLFLSAYNEAYFFACNTALKPEATDTLRLDEASSFDPAALAHQLAPAGVLSVVNAMAYTGAAGCGQAPAYAFRQAADGRIVVPAAPAGTEVRVTYRRAPAELINETPTVPGSGSVPELLPTEYQGSLAGYAAAAFFRVRRKFERMQVWTDAWMTAVQQMQERARPGSLGIRGAFVRMP